MVQSLSPGGGDVRVDSLSGFLDVVPEAEGIPANDEDLDNVISENSVTLADPGVDPSLPLCISVADEDVKKQAIQENSPVSSGIPGRSSYLITSLTCLYPHGIETVRSDILYWYSDW